MGGLKPISWRSFEKFLLSVNCTLVRIRGDHLIYNRPGLLRPVVVPKVRDIPIFILQNNLRILGLRSEDFMEWLKANKK